MDKQNAVLRKLLETFQQTSEYQSIKRPRKNWGHFSPIFFSKCSSRHVECSLHSHSGECFFQKHDKVFHKVLNWLNTKETSSGRYLRSKSSRGQVEFTFGNRFEKIYAKTKTFSNQNPIMKNTSKFQLVSKRFSGQVEFRSHTILLKLLWECRKTC